MIFICFTFWGRFSFVLLFGDVFHLFYFLGKFFICFTFQDMFQFYPNEKALKVSRSTAAGGDPKATQGNPIPWPIKTTYPSMLVLVYRPLKDERLS